LCSCWSNVLHLRALDGAIPRVRVHSQPSSFYFASALWGVLAMSSFSSVHRQKCHQATELWRTALCTQIASTRRCPGRSSGEPCPTRALLQASLQQLPSSCAEHERYWLSRIRSPGYGLRTMDWSPVIFNPPPPNDRGKMGGLFKLWTEGFPCLG
jgi:hypothetical protein